MGSSARTASVERNTKETQISVTVNLDGTGVYNVSTGIGFLDHMLEQLSRHSLMDLDVQAKGDLHIDGHHTTEDCGIAIGEAVKQALGDRAGITRYGSALCPLDEALTRAVVDCSNRPYLVWKVGFSRPKVGDFDTELFREWFQAFAQAAGIVALSAHEDLAGMAVYLLGLDKVRFRKPVRPGDQVLITAVKAAERRGIWNFDVVATVDGVKVADGGVMATVAKHAD